MAYSTTDKLIGDIQKNDAGEVVRVSRVAYKSGNEALDVRTYYTNEKGELAPTKKGIRVSSESLPELMKLMVDGMSTEEKMDFFDNIKVYLEELG